MKGDVLSGKQERFCQEYVISLNATKAAEKAGYSPKTANEMGSENLTKPSIQARLKELNKKTLDKLEVDQEWVMKRFLEISNRCIQAEPVLDKEGNPTGEYRFDSSGANKATENIAKHLGFFEADNKQSAPTISNLKYSLKIQKNDEGS